MAPFEDHLSVLPDDILLKILSKTRSYRCAVTASRLSKRFRTLYTQIPVLYLHSKDVLGKRALYDANLFGQIVNTSLIRRRDYLQSLHLYANHVETSWLQLAAFRKVRRLHIRSNSPNLFLSNMDPSSFSHLVHCNICLSGTIYNANWIETLISGSPLLEELHFRDCNFCCPLQISSSSLSVLRFSNCCIGDNRVEISSTSLYKLHFKHCQIRNTSSNLCIKCPNLFGLGTDYCDTETAREITSQNPSVKRLVLHGVRTPPCKSLWRQLVDAAKFESLWIDFNYKKSVVVESANLEDEKIGVDENGLEKLEHVERCVLSFSWFGEKEKRFVDQILDKCSKLEVLKIRMRASVPLKVASMKEKQQYEHRNSRRILVVTSRI